MSAGPILLKRRPATVEAWQVTEDNIEEIATWCGGVPLPYRGVGLHTDNNDFVVAGIGAWVVRGQHGEFYPVPEAGMWSRFEAVIASVRE